MSFNKRYAKREIILSNLNSIDYISNITKADALIIDNWSDNFYKNFDFKYKKYNEIRNLIISENKFDSSHREMLAGENFNKLKKLSNVYINLKTNPNWVDIHLANSIIEGVIPDDISGKFELLVEYFIKKIDDYFLKDKDF